MLNRAAALLFLLVFVPLEGLAHGERAMQATTRMRTINWYDVVSISTCSPATR